MMVLTSISSDALPIFLVALHCWLRNPSEPVEVIQSCLQTGGAMEMTAAVGGALVGSSIGEDRFPQALLTGLVESSEIIVSATRLFERQRQERGRRSS